MQYLYYFDTVLVNNSNYNKLSEKFVYFKLTYLL